MITKQILNKWPLVVILGLTMTIISCGDDEEPDVAPADFAYPASTVAVGSEGSIEAPVVEGGNIMFTLLDNGGADFITVDAATGNITVAAESSTGSYTIMVEASNSAGMSTGTAELTVGVSDEFNPVGQAFHASYFINQQEDAVLTGLDGVPGLPFPELELPLGWPTADTPDELVDTYFILSGIMHILWNVPAETVCEENNTLGPVFVLGEDLSINVPGCQDGSEPDGPAGQARIDYADGTYSLRLDLTFLPGVAVPYTITGAMIGDFTDPTSGETVQALQGRVLSGTVPTNLESPETIEDVTSWEQWMMDVVFIIQ